MGAFKINIKLEKLPKEFKKIAKNLKKADESIQSNLNVEMKIIGNDLVNKIKMSMRNTQRDLTKSYIKGNKIHHPSKKGQPPAIDTSDLVNSILFDNPKNLELEFGSTQKHGAYLEDRDKTGLDRPFLDPMYNQEEDSIINRISEVVSLQLGDNIL
jgi:hypothetical protein